jgi:hypothetical protein
VSSYEEGAGADPKYACCTFRGSVVALDAFTGHSIWQTYLVEEPKQIGVSKRGVKMFGPSGVAVWSSAHRRCERSAVYVATGDNYSQPASAMSDAAVALDLATGRILWHQQLRPDDMWNLACVGEDKTNCPEDAGPDYDFGATPVLATAAGTKQRVVLMGQKSSEVYALDPDREGTVVWKKKLGTGGLLGGIQWGFAADDRNVYFPLSDVVVIDEPGKPAGSIRRRRRALRAGSRDGRRALARAAVGLRRPAAVQPGAVTGDDGHSRRGVFRRDGRRDARVLDGGWPASVVVRHRAQLQDGQRCCGQGWDAGRIWPDCCRWHLARHVRLPAMGGLPATCCSP